MRDYSTLKKTNIVLHVILLIFLAICCRIWHLTIVQKESRLEEARKPERRVILDHAHRGTIWDREGKPLALNCLKYNASIYYSHIKQIPSIEWKRDLDGKSFKTFPRKEYIKKLSLLLEKELGLDHSRVEDLIHSKASILPHSPLIVKEKLSEREYYRLKMLEKEWIGVSAEISSERVYPLGAVGGNVVGWMGKISSKKYFEIANKIRELSLYAVQDRPSIPYPFKNKEEVQKELERLKKKAYNINDLSGKSGIEAAFEERLSGFHGKKIFLVDNNESFLKEVISQEKPISGEKIVLSISSTLQKFAEELLIREESRSTKPFIRGGAIVVMNPTNGEILAIASNPRINPNEFIHPSLKTFTQLESEDLVAAIWDGRIPLIKESLKGTVSQPLTLSFFLDSMAPSTSHARKMLDKISSVKEAIRIQEDFEELLFLKKETKDFLSEIPDERDKLFVIDLLRIVVYAPSFSDDLIKKVGTMSLQTYWNLSKEVLKREPLIRGETFPFFHKNHFVKWREKNEKDFLKKVRELEAKRKISPRPYIDYLEKKEKELFAKFWEENRALLLAASLDKTSFKKLKISQKHLNELDSFSLNETVSLIKTVRPFSKLNRSLVGHYPKMSLEKHLAASFYPKDGFGYARSFALSSAPFGSIFKLVVAYSALKTRFDKNEPLNPLTIVDRVEERGGKIVVAFLDNKPIFRYYKGGRLPKSSQNNIGEVNLVTAIAHSSDPYFALLAGDIPLQLLENAKKFGFSSKTGIDLPGESKGTLPTDLESNKTGLYSFGIGQHTLTASPIQAAVMLSAIANGGKILKPQIIVGKREEKGAIDLPSPVRQTILKGMREVMIQGSASPDKIVRLKNDHILLKEYESIIPDLAGKTSTAEATHKLYPLPSEKAKIYNHTWFGAISFKGSWETPELVVIVYLPFGKGGKEVAPLATQIIKKYREMSQ